jgi:hypothetical protein
MYCPIYKEKTGPKSHKRGGPIVRKNRSYLTLGRKIVVRSIFSDGEMDIHYRLRVKKNEFTDVRRKLQTELTLKGAHIFLSVLKL